MAEDPAPDRGRGEDPAGGPAPGFAAGGPLDTALPGAALTQDLDHASGPVRSCAGASDDEAFGILGGWEATEAWSAAAKLGVIRELTRRRTEPGPDGRLSSACVDGLVLEISNQLSISKRAAGGLIDLAADLEARLVLTGKALAAGVISLAKVRIIAEATAALDDAHAAAAETLIAGDLAGKTPGQIAALIARAVVTVDPEGAKKRRERAQKEDARVRFWREHAGTGALAAYGLPADEALAANQHIQDRALAYKAAGMPGTMDQLRVRAFLDALNGAPAPAPAGPTDPDTTDPDTTDPDATDPDATDPDATDPAGNGGPGTGAGVAANIMLTVPLTTLLWCITVTDEQGHAIGHGCAKLRRARRKPSQTRRKPDRTSPHASRDGPGLTFTPPPPPAPTAATAPGT